MLKIDDSLLSGKHGLMGLEGKIGEQGPRGFKGLFIYYLFKNKSIQTTIFVVQVIGEDVGRRDIEEILAWPD